MGSRLQVGSKWCNRGLRLRRERGACLRLVGVASGVSRALLGSPASRDRLADQRVAGKRHSSTSRRSSVSRDAGVWDAHARHLGG
jgi:hypothetical protein